MHDVEWHREVNCVHTKDAQKQLAQTSLNRYLLQKSYISNFLVKETTPATLLRHFLSLKNNTANYDDYAN